MKKRKFISKPIFSVIFSGIVGLIKEMEYRKFISKLIFSVLFSGVVGLILTIIIHLMIIGLSDGYNQGNSYLFSGLCTLLSAILAILGVCFTIFNNQRLKNKELLNELDQKSEWRKELMNIAARPSISTKDVYRTLASLRFLPKKEIEIYDIKIKEKYKDKDKEKIEKFIGKNKDKDFDVISNYIYNRLIEILKKQYKNANIDEKLTNAYLSIRKSEEIRLYILFLLKHHWEYNQSEEKKEKFIDIERKEFKNVLKQVDEITTESNFEHLFRKGDENFNHKTDEYKNFEIKINKLDENTKKCIMEQENTKRLVLKNITLEKKFCKWLLKGQYRKKE